MDFIIETIMVGLIYLISLKRVYHQNVHRTFDFGKMSIGNFHCQMSTDVKCPPARIFNEDVSKLNQTIASAPKETNKRHRINLIELVKECSYC